MSQIKLNPYVDLGLSADPASNNAAPSGANKPLDNAIPGTTGVTDISRFTGSLNYGPSNNYRTLNVDDFNPSEFQLESSPGNSFDKGKVFFILVLVLFLASLGALVFFGLQYFRVI